MRRLKLLLPATYTLLLYSVLLVITLSQPGCNRTVTIKEERASVKISTVGSADHLLVNAYLFDLKIRDHKARRSVRLNLYFADTIALFTARGYLGKGVGRGLWWPDSALFYFPTEGEYYAGSFDGIADNSCLTDGPLQKALPKLLSATPAELREIDGLTITQQKKNKIRASLILGSCPGPLELRFDKPGGGETYHLKEFKYDGADGKSIIYGKRRTIKIAKEFETRKFSLNIPPEAVRLNW